MFESSERPATDDIEASDFESASSDQGGLSQAHGDEQITRRKKATVKKRWIVMCVLLIILAITPTAVRLYLQSFLEQQGAADAQIDRLVINPFIGRVTIGGVAIDVSGDSQETTFPSLRLDHLMIDVGLGALFKKRLHIEALDVSGLNMPIHYEPNRLLLGVPIRLSAQNQTPEEAENDGVSDWTFGVDQLQLSDVHLELRYLTEDEENQTLDNSVETSLVVERLSLSQLNNWNLSSLADVALQATIDEAPLSIEAMVQPFNQSLEHELKLKLEQLSLSPFKPLLYLVGVEGFDTWEVSTDVILRLGVKPNLLLEVEGEVSLLAEQLKVKQNNESWLFSTDVTWQGQHALTMEDGQSALVIKRARLDQRFLSAVMPQALGLSHKGFTVNLNDLAVRLNRAAVADPVDDDIVLSLADAGLELSGVVVRDQQEDVELLTAERLGVSEIHLEALDDIRIGEVELDELSLVKNSQDSANDPVLSLKKFSANLMQISLDVLSVDYVGLESIHGDVVLNASNQEAVATPILASLHERFSFVEEPSAEAVGVEQESQPPASEKARAISLGRFQISGDSRIRLLSMGEVAGSKPSLEHTVKVKQVTVSDIDSRDVQRESPVDIELATGPYSEIKVAGWIKAFSAEELRKSDLDLKIDVNRLDLPPFTAYTESQIGCSIDSGRLALDARWQQQGGKLKSRNKALLEQLNVAAQDEALIEETTQQLNMPLATALGILKDGDGNIELEFTIEGDLDDPEVGINQVVRLAIVQAIKKGSMSYLMVALQPYGAALLLANQVGNRLDRVGLDPVSFDPHALYLSEDAQGYLPKLAELLKRKDHLTVRLCPVITEDERTQTLTNMNDKIVQLTDQQLQGMAEARAALVQYYLVEQYGLSPDQLLMCRPRKGKGMGRVEISL